MPACLDLGLFTDLLSGDIVCIQGPSGAGKSTLLKCLAHLNPYEGQVLLRGMQVYYCCDKTIISCAYV